jgi:hypothetical protein
MLHGFVEITHAPVNKTTCEDFMTDLRAKYGEEPYGCNLAMKHATESKFVVMCYFATPEGYDYAWRLALSNRWQSCTLKQNLGKGISNTYVGSVGSN